MVLLILRFRQGNGLVCHYFQRLSAHHTCRRRSAPGPVCSRKPRSGTPRRSRRCTRDIRLMESVGDDPKPARHVPQRPFPHPSPTQLPRAGFPPNCRVPQQSSLPVSWPPNHQGVHARSLLRTIPGASRAATPQNSSASQQTPALQHNRSLH